MGSHGPTPLAEAESARLSPPLTVDSRTKLGSLAEVSSGGLPASIAESAIAPEDGWGEVEVRRGGVGVR